MPCFASSSLLPSVTAGLWWNWSIPLSWSLCILYVCNTASYAWEVHAYVQLLVRLGRAVKGTEDVPSCITISSLAQSSLLALTLGNCDHCCCHLLRFWADLFWNRIGMARGEQFLFSKCFCCCWHQYKALTLWNQTRLSLEMTKKRSVSLSCLHFYLKNIVAREVQLPLYKSNNFFSPSIFWTLSFLYHFNEPFNRPWIL